MEHNIPLKEEIDPDYEPTKEEVLEYAEFLGLQLPRDNDLLYLAREGLKAPMPEPWQPYKAANGEIYYFNYDTGESQWIHPCDQLYQETVATLQAQRLKTQRLKPHRPPKPKPVQQYSANSELNSLKEQLIQEYDAQRDEILREITMATLAAQQQIEAVGETEKAIKEQEHKKTLTELEKQVKTVSEAKMKEIRKELTEEKQERLKQTNTTHAIGPPIKPLKLLRNKLQNKQEDKLALEEVKLQEEERELMQALDREHTLAQQSVATYEKLKSEYQAKLQEQVQARRDTLQQHYEAKELEYTNTLALSKGSSPDKKTLKRSQEECEALYTSEVRLYEEELQDTFNRRRNESRATQHSDQNLRTLVQKQKRKMTKALDEELRTYARSKEKELSKELAFHKKIQDRMHTGIDLFNSYEAQLDALTSELRGLQAALRFKETVLAGLPLTSIDQNKIEEKRIRPPPAPINPEKDWLKAEQQQLNEDRKRWTQELKAYKANPTPEKKAELAHLKQVIERNIAEHNAKVKQLREYEAGDLQNLEPFKKPWWMQHPRQPWEEYNAKLCRRQVHRWVKKRDVANHMVVWHGHWLNNANHELKAMNKKF